MWLTRTFCPQQPHQCVIHVCFLSRLEVDMKMPWCARSVPNLLRTAWLRDCLSVVRLRSRFLLNSFWRQLLTHYKARTEALCESIEKSPIDVNGSKARGTFVAQFVGDRLAVQRSVIRKASPALASGQHLSLSDNAMLRQLEGLNLIQ